MFFLNQWGPKNPLNTLDLFPVQFCVMSFPPTVLLLYLRLLVVSHWSTTLSVNSKQPVFHFNPFKNRAFANPRFQHRFLPASRHHVTTCQYCWWLLVVVGGSSNEQLTTTFQQFSKAKPSHFGVPPWGMFSEPSRETMSQETMSLCCWNIPTVHQDLHKLYWMPLVMTNIAIENAWKL